MKAPKELLLALFIFLPTFLSAQGIVRRNGTHFVRDGREYRFNGTNMWYAAILGSTGQGGNRARLCRELDRLKAMGITNIRALAGGSDGTDARPSHTWPSLQPEPGVYNDTLLQGLDFFVAELEKRQMTCVLYLNNSWDWSGGFGTYLEWAGHGRAPEGSADWDRFQQYHSHFTQCRKAMRLSASHTRFMVSRTNTITGRPYKESPAIMAWEICNEPRPFTQCGLLAQKERTSIKKSFVRWINAQARLIKECDPNHLVTTGSEGFYGCAQDTDLLVKVHASKHIDYCCLHCWPNNWSWCGPAIGNTQSCKERNGVTAPQDSLQNAIRMSRWYISMNCSILAQLGKPIVLEEYGYPRDNYEIKPGTPVTARKRYYAFIASWNSGTQESRNLENKNSPNSILAGTNFWGWAGEAIPPHDNWQKWDPYTADPAQEEQGLYSVFMGD